MEVAIRGATFIPYPHHLVLLEHNDRRMPGIHPWSHLVPSIRFAELATRSGGRLQFSTSLLERRPYRWSPYRMPTADVPAAVRRYPR